MTALIAAVREAQRGAPRLPLTTAPEGSIFDADRDEIACALGEDDGLAEPRARFLATAANAVGPLCDLIECIADSDPWISYYWTNDDGYGYESSRCGHCRGEDVHGGDCAWIAARRLTGRAP